VAYREFPKSGFNIDKTLEELSRVNITLLTIPREKWICRVSEFCFQRGKLGL
jgi:hypothetical protein